MLAGPRAVPLPPMSAGAIVGQKCNLCGKGMIVYRQLSVSRHQSISQTKTGATTSAHRSPGHSRMGNQAAQRLLREGVIQAKLTVNQPGDRFEQEADRVAEKVMGMTGTQPVGEFPVVGRAANSSIRRLCSSCNWEMEMQSKSAHVQRRCLACEEEVNRKSKISTEQEVPGDLEGQFGTLSSGGQPLSESTRAFFEPRFGQDFNEIRVHTKASAAETARSINALAYTKGQDIVFAPGQYQPDSYGGRKLLAHELTHVVQQADTKGSAMIRRTCNPPGIAGVVTARGGCGALDTSGFLSGGLGPFRFNKNCDDFAPGASVALLTSVAGVVPATTTFEVHGFASVDGDPTFNENLGCARALKAQKLLTDPVSVGGAGLSGRVTGIVNHGPTPGPTSDRRSVVVRTTTPPAPTPVPTPPPTPIPTPIATTCTTPTNPDRSGTADNPTTDGENTVALLNPLDALDALSCRNDAFAAASSSGLVGPHLGPQDAFRHCFWNCCMAQEMRATEAEKFGTGHENSSPSAIPFDNQMDLHNNTIGRDLGTPGANCDTECMTAVTSGLLRTIRGPHTSSPAVPPVTTTCIGSSDQPWP